MRIVFIIIYASGAQPNLSGQSITLIIFNINKSLYAKYKRTHHTKLIEIVNLSNRRLIKN